MLDEIDKVGTDFRGDPASALLEVLDPEQNFTFSDHYLDVPFDLSQVHVHHHGQHPGPHSAGPARPDGDHRAARLHRGGEAAHRPTATSIPRQLEENGLTPEQIDFTDEAIRLIIRDYTREAGVRNLEREIGSVCRRRRRAGRRRQDGAA